MGNSPSLRPVQKNNRTENFTELTELTELYSLFDSL